MLMYANPRYVGILRVTYAHRSTGWYLNTNLELLKG
jgi:hypothetical protein